MLWWSVSQYLLKQQWILDQARARDVQEAPQVQLPAKGRLEAALQEVLHPPILLLLVQQGLGLHLVAAVRGVAGETGELQPPQETPAGHARQTARASQRSVRGETLTQSVRMRPTCSVEPSGFLASRR